MSDPTPGSCAFSGLGFSATCIRLVRSGGGKGGCAVTSAPPRSDSVPPASSLSRLRREISHTNDPAMY